MLLTHRPQKQDERKAGSFQNLEGQRPPLGQETNTRCSSPGSRNSGRNTHTYLNRMSSKKPRKIFPVLINFDRHPGSCISLLQVRTQNLHPEPPPFPNNWLYHPRPSPTLLTPQGLDLLWKSKTRNYLSKLCSKLRNALCFSCVWDFRLSEDGWGQRAVCEQAYSEWLTLPCEGGQGLTHSTFSLLIVSPIS